MDWVADNGEKAATEETTATSRSVICNDGLVAIIIVAIFVDNLADSFVPS